MRSLVFLLLLCHATRAEEPRGKVVDGELPAANRRDDPLAFATYLATTAPKDKPLPLILALHAGKGTARQFVGFLRSFAEAQGALLAGPRGLRELVGADGYWWKGDRKETAALDRLLAHLLETRRIDPKRITLVGLADGAELGLKWAMKKKRGLQGLVLVNFLFKPGSWSALRGTKVCVFACRDAKEKKHSLSQHAEATAASLARGKVACVLRIMPGASRSFFHGWEKEFRKAYQWFEGKLDWPSELAPPK